jgi:hypothetical protein
MQVSPCKHQTVPPGKLEDDGPPVSGELELPGGAGISMLVVQEKNNAAQSAAARSMG